MEEFEKMALDFRNRIKELQIHPARNLDPQDFEALRRDKELRSKSANYRLLGENDKADALGSEILNLQPRVKKIKEKLAETPSGQQQIFETIATTPDSELHQLALKIYATGVKEFEEVLDQIEKSEQELVKLHNGLIANAKERARLETQKVNVYLKLKEIGKCLPTSENEVEFPQKAPSWAHFMPDEDKIGKAYGNRPILLRSSVA